MAPRVENPVCRSCGNEFIQTGRGRKNLYCPDCRVVKNEEQQGRTMVSATLQANPEELIPTSQDELYEIALRNLGWILRSGRVPVNLMARVSLEVFKQLRPEVGVSSDELQARIIRMIDPFQDESKVEKSA